MALNNATVCVPFLASTITVEYNSPITIGDVCNIANYPSNRINYCFTINNTSEPGTLSAGTVYSNCYDCLVNNYAVVRLTSCSRGNFITVPLSGFTSIPTFGETYYLEVSIPQKTGPATMVRDCFSVIQKNPVIQLSPDDFNKAVSEFQISTILSTPIVYGTCDECYSANSIPYLVRRCGTTDIDCVDLLNGQSYLQHVISYSQNGIDLYCGEVLSASTGACSTFYNFIADYGTGQRDLCTTCLSVGNEKLLLRNCLDSNITQVVWAASVYNGGETSHLSTQDGCFEVVSATTDNVTNNNYLNFDPSDGCNPCLECNGIGINWTSCNEETSGTFNSFQLLTVGEVFYFPNYGCCYVTSISEYIVNAPNFYSLYTFGTECSTCESLLTPPQLWLASACTSGNVYYNYTVLAPAGSNAGDVYKINWGSNPFICVSLITTIPAGIGDGQIYATFLPSLQDSCEKCLLNSEISLTAINCLTNQVSLVSITQQEYIDFTGLGFSIPYSVLKTTNECYYVPNDCPQTGGTKITITDFLNNCFDCVSELPPPPRSAGTENFICVVCCPCDSGGTTNFVSGPHPDWTDGYGTSVTQLNSFTLGGMFGLNS